MDGLTGDTTASRFAARLRQERLDAGLTQAALAERAGLSLRGIQHLEAAGGLPYPDTVRRLADAFGLTGEARGAFTRAARATSARGANDLSSPLPAPPMVGRSAELAQLRAALRDAAAGHGRTVLVCGEPGSGKSRLVERLAEDAGRFGVRPCWGMCWEGASTPPFWPWVQLIRQYGRDRSPEELASELDAAGIRHLLPELAGAAAPSQSQSEQDRFWLFDAITRFFGRAAQAEPLLLVLEDLHWSDAASVLLLRFFARQLRQSAVLVVGTYRDTEIGPEHPVSQLAGELTSEHERCALAGLGRDELGDLLERLTGGLLDPETVSSVHQRTGGNPLFATELAHLAAAHEGRDLRLVELGAEPPAARLRSLIERR